MSEAKTQHAKVESERAEQGTDAHTTHQLLDISQALFHLTDTQETLELLVDRTRSLLEVDIVAVATVDDFAGTTSWKAVAGLEMANYRDRKFAPGRGTAGRAMEARATVVLEDIGESQELTAEEFPILKAEGVRNALGVPLIVGDRVTGALVAGYRSDRKFNKQQIRVVEAISAQAAIAIENARLFTQLAAANRRLTEADQLKTELIADLSTPVIPIWDRVLLAPIVGTFNSDRAEALTEALLAKTSGGGAEVVILDITGVRTVDTEAAQRLRNTITAVRVLGAECVLTGIGPAIAQTLVRLGITLQDIETRRKLSDGLQLALEIIGTRS